MLFLSAQALSYLFPPEWSRLFSHGSCPNVRHLWARSVGMGYGIPDITPDEIISAEGDFHKEIYS